MTWYTSTDSTNAQAGRLARSHAPHGTLVVADAQQAGRGRFDRTWQAAQGKNVLFSLVLHPPLATADLGLVSLASAVAVVEGIASIVGVGAQVKWPNDVLVGGRKVCGILIESSFSSSTTTRPTLVLGIGLNVNQDAFSSTLPNATSLLLETGQPTDRVALLAHILLRLEVRLDALSHARGRSSLRSAYTRHLAHLEETISVYRRQHDAPLTGVCEGIDPSGALLLRTPEGIQSLHAGELTLRRR
ncbi:MAG: biotin--[acetyl-CoA-carboxylase] ligase [Rhodothermales bacterium]